MNDKEIILKFLEGIENSYMYLGEGHAKGYYKLFSEEPEYDFLFKNISDGRLDSIFVNLEEKKVLRVVQYPMSHDEAAKRAEEESLPASIDVYVDFEGCYDARTYYDYTCYLFEKLENFETFLKELKSENSIKIKKHLIKKGELVFDKDNGIISYKDKKCKIPLTTVQYYIANAVFSIKPFGVKIKANDIYEEYFEHVIERKRTIYDGCIALNKKIKKDLGLENLFQNKAALVYLNEKYFSK